MKKNFLNQFLIYESYRGSRNPNLTSGEFCKGKPVAPATCTATFLQGILLTCFGLKVVANFKSHGAKQLNSCQFEKITNDFLNGIQFRCKNV